MNTALVNGVSQTSLRRTAASRWRSGQAGGLPAQHLLRTARADFAASSVMVCGLYGVRAGKRHPVRAAGKLKAATRGAFADVLAKAFPEEALESKVNFVEDGGDPRCRRAYYADAAYLVVPSGRPDRLGRSPAGRLLPDSTIKRSEVAAIVTRMVEPALRQTATLVWRR